MVTNIEAARVFHRALEDFVHPNTVVLFGTGVRTDTQVTITSSAVNVAQPTDGDGTVPAISANLENFTTPSIALRQAFNGAEHGGIFKDTSVIPTLPSAVTLALAAVIRGI